MLRYYKLIDNKLVEVPMIEWARSFEKNGHWLYRTRVPTGGTSEAFISTILIGFGYKAPYFETMSFIGDHEHHQVRCFDVAHARVQHDDLVREAKTLTRGLRLLTYQPQRLLTYEPK